MRRFLPVVLLYALSQGNTACIAYRAATPSWLNGESNKLHTEAQHARAVRRRGVIATSVGAAELLIATGAFPAIGAGALSDEDSESETVGGGFKDAGAELVGYLFLGGVGAFLAVDGFTSLVCGATDLLSSSTCDGQVIALEAEDPEDCIACATPLPAQSDTSTSPESPIQQAESRAAEHKRERSVGAHEPTPADVMLIVGDFEHRGGSGATAIRFAPDHRFWLGANRDHLEMTQFEELGTWKLDGNQLTLTTLKGPCAGSTSTKTGVYAVSVSKVGLRFTGVRDACKLRASMSDATWWRMAE